MREALKTSSSKYAQDSNSAISIENVASKGLQLIIKHAGKKFYTALSNFPLHPDEHKSPSHLNTMSFSREGNMGIGGSATQTLSTSAGARFTINNLRKTGQLGKSLVIDHDIASTVAANYTASQIDVDRTGGVSSGTDNVLGLDIDVNTTGASGGTITSTGLDIDVTGDTGGTSKAIGLDVAVASADTNYAALFNGGNVGIGTTSPSVELEVNGDIKCDTINVQYEYIRAALDYNQTGGTFVCLLLDGGTRPKTSFAGSSENCCMIAPHDGTLQFILFRSESVAGNPVVIGFHKATDGTEVPSDTPTASVSNNMSSVADDTTTKFTFTGSNTFSAGDVLGFSIDPANDINDCLFVICIKYDTTTNV